VTDETFHGGPECWNMITDEEWAGLVEAGGGVWSPSISGVIVLGQVPFIAGVTYDLVDETATAVYFDEAGNLNPDLTATTSWGEGTFLEVTPGEYQVEFGGTATNCSPLTAWPGDAANRLRVPVLAGYFSYASMNCDGGL